MKTRAKLIGVVLGLLTAGACAVGLLTQHRPGVEVIYLGTWTDGWPEPRPHFVISNSHPYRITFSWLAVEYQRESSWTRSEIPTVMMNGRKTEIRFGGQELEPGSGYQFVGAPATNIPYRIPVVWGLDPKLAIARPQWKQVADNWCDRIGIRPLFLPYGIVRSPTIAPAGATMPSK